MKAPHTKKIPVILLFGPPGSGKGTQGKLLSTVAQHYHLSSGDIFRGLSADSPAGKLYARYAHQGLLVPDDVTIEICCGYIEELIASKRYVPSRQFLLLDGLPRTKKQAEMLDRYIDVKKIIVFDVPSKEVLIERLMKRAQLENRADDGKKEVLAERMKAYDKQTVAVLVHYPKELVLTFNADQKQLEVLRDILSELCPLLANGP